MSYILDALKRSEQERHQENVAGLSSDMMMLPTKQKKSQWWPYLLAAILLLNLAAYVFFYWFEKPIALHVDTTQGVSTPEEVGIEKEVQAAPEIKKQEPSGYGSENRRIIPDHVSKVPALQKRFDYSDFDRNKQLSVPAQEYRSNDPASETYVDGGLLIQPRSKRNALVRRPEQADNVHQAGGNRPDDVSTEAEKPAQKTIEKSTVTVAPESFGGIPHLTELSKGFQRSVQDLTFNSHIYSDQPSSRRVMINNIYLREGQGFLGMQLNEIGEFYIVLEKDNRQFKLPVLRDWLAQ